MPNRNLVGRWFGRTTIESDRLLEKIDQLEIAFLFVQLVEQDVVATGVEEHETVLVASKQVQESVHVFEIDERPDEIFANQVPTPSVVLVDSGSFQNDPIVLENQRAFKELARAGLLFVLLEHRVEFGIRVENVADFDQILFGSIDVQVFEAIRRVFFEEHRNVTNQS